MKNVRLKLLYPPGIQREHTASARAGLDYFKRFGVMIEEASVKAPKALRGVHLGFEVARIITRNVPLNPHTDLSYNTFRGGLYEFIYGSGVLPVGLTPFHLFQTEGEGVTAHLGLSRFRNGAVASIARASMLDPSLQRPTIQKIFIHEAGHIFIQGYPNGQMKPKNGILRIVRSETEDKAPIEKPQEGSATNGLDTHCKNEGCIMQENKNVDDFVERVVKPGLELCGDCQAQVSMTISELLMELR